MQKLNSNDIKILYNQLDGWDIRSGKLEKIFEFKDFKAAIEFMNLLAPVAEKLNHHPDWSNSYNKVTIQLSTHEAGGLTDKDFLLAKEAEKAARLITR